MSPGTVAELLEKYSRPPVPSLTYDGPCSSSAALGPAGAQPRCSGSAQRGGARSACGRCRRGRSLAAVVLRLTKNRPLPAHRRRTKSSAAELTGAPRSSGAPNGSCRCAPAWRPRCRAGPGRPAGPMPGTGSARPGDWIGQPSRNCVFDAPRWRPRARRPSAPFPSARDSPRGGAPSQRATATLAPATAMGADRLLLTSPFGRTDRRRRARPRPPPPGRALSSNRSRELARRARGRLARSKTAARSGVAIRVCLTGRVSIETDVRASTSGAFPVGRAGCSSPTWSPSRAGRSHATRWPMRSGTMSCRPRGSRRSGCS